MCRLRHFSEKGMRSIVPSRFLIDDNRRSSRRFWRRNLLMTAVAMSLKILRRGTADKLTSPERNALMLIS